MLNFIRVIFIVLLSLPLQACLDDGSNSTLNKAIQVSEIEGNYTGGTSGASSSSSSEVDGGINTGNPAYILLPKKLWPDAKTFDSGDRYFNEDLTLSATAEFTDSQVILLQGYVNQIAQSYRETRSFFALQKVFNQIYVKKLAELGVDRIIEGQTIEFIVEATLTGPSEHTWKYEFSVDDVEEQTIRLMITEVESNTVVSTYVFKVVGQTASKGVIVIVNPNALKSNTFEDQRIDRYTGFVFDLSDVLKPKFLLRKDVSGYNMDYFGVGHIHYQCSVEKMRCLGERIGIRTKAPERTLSKGLRFRYNPVQKKVCFHTRDYNSESVLSSAVLVNLVDANIEGYCQLEFETSWADHVYKESDLPIRVLDEVEDQLPTALEFHREDGSLEGWNSVEIEWVDLWLKAKF